MGTKVKLHFDIDLQFPLLITAIQTLSQGFSKSQQGYNINLRLINP